MKKFFVLLTFILVLVCGFVLWQKSEDNYLNKENIKNLGIDNKIISEKVYTFNLDTLSPECSETDEMLCAVESAVKCTINPDLQGCSDKFLPKFIFMKDPSLERPTEVSYKITDKKVLINETVEIYTQSSCNGGWFGLCQGTIIYVIALDENGKWNRVKDLYGIE